ncbi:MAG: DUF1926 domain-containing protein [Bacteroidales bacterium]|nr:DUF1926 domain-containing protein [Candidatus Latescibacterota bacterium]
MDKKVHFVLGIHNHQPVGNFDHVIEDAYQKAYRPFIEVMEEYPDIPFALHNSGILWDWLEDKHPDYIKRVSRMVRGGGIELMSAGYYEPILTVIPERDRQGQLAMMKDYLVDRFKAEPRGCWLTERIWDPHLPDTLAGAGLEYVIVDDSHFKSTGFLSSEMRGYFMTEENGSYIKVFPIDRGLRYLVPFHEPEEVIKYFREIYENGGDQRKIAVLADDGEKFGLWPGTNDLCYRQDWLRRFCDALRTNSDWLSVTTFPKVIDSVRPLGIVYLPTASYSEMMEWALPLKAQVAHQQAKEILEASGSFAEPAEAVRGGLWRNFLVKYEESNWMHKRMLSVSKKIDEWNRKDQVGSSTDHSSVYHKALSHLYQAQCNCAYWHGLFGGLYLPHLRSAIFKHLIEAENVISDDESDGRSPSWEIVDMDGDGVDEILVANDSMRAWFKRTGGTLRELDSISPAFNLTDTLTRREELYHVDVKRIGEEGGGDPDSTVSIHNMAVVREEGLEKKLYYDGDPRLSLVDRFLPVGEGAGDIGKGIFTEIGDFHDALYDLKTESDNGLRLVFTRKGSVAQDDEERAVVLKKIVSIDGSSPALDVEYSITPEGGGLSCRFAVENVFSFLAGDAPDRYFEFPGKELDDRKLASTGEVAGVKEMSLVDEWLNLRVDLEMEPASLFWRFPVETVSNSDSGYERVYQGSAVVPLWDIDAADGKTVIFRIRIMVRPAFDGEGIDR